jgi:ribosome biogenesis GTPase
MSQCMSKKKVRVELRKNRTKPPRINDLTHQFQEDSGTAGDALSGERVRAKGDVSRHRTVMLTDGEGAMPEATSEAIAGRVLRVHGLYTYVEVEDRRVFRCTTRRLLKSLSTDERSVVTTGDLVSIRPEPNNLEGMIERVEPRHGVLTRASRRREHVVVANVDQLLIVMSLVEPELKPHLIDRYIATAQRGELNPILLLNKADLVDPAEYQPMVGYYSQLGIPTLLTSSRSGFGIERLRELLSGRASVFSGQSGVGKSSLLNAIQPNLSLRVGLVSDVNDKGKHTTTTAELIRLESGGWVVDTPGVRQLQLWDTRPEEVEGMFAEFLPLVPYCNYADCTHIHEQGCAVKDALRKRHISERRYLSYLGLFNGLAEDAE